MRVQFTTVWYGIRGIYAPSTGTTASRLDFIYFKKVRESIRQ